MQNFRSMYSTNEMRVISRTGATGILTDRKGGGNIESYVNVEALRKFMPPDLPGLTIEFDLKEVINKRSMDTRVKRFLRYAAPTSAP